MKREEVGELVERGIRELNEALAAGKSDRLQKYLDVMARLPRYSFNNCILGGDAISRSSDRSGLPCLEKTWTVSQERREGNRHHCADDRSQEGRWRKR